jgi:hypothetical protein
MALIFVKPNRIVVVGEGGGWLTPFLLAFFNSCFNPEVQLILVDGGIFTFDQGDHEFFLYPGNKARVTAEFIRCCFPNLLVEAVPKYVGLAEGSSVVTPQQVIRSGDIVFLQVDNARTKHLIETHALTLPNITIISGGTNLDQVRVLVYLRRNNVDLTPPMSSYCSDVANPSDKVRREDGCLERVREMGDTHPFAMLTASILMLDAFCMVCRLEAACQLSHFPYYELWHDVAAGRTRAEKPPANP